MSVSFEDVVWTLVFLFSVRCGCWLLREWSVARGARLGGSRLVKGAAGAALYSLDVPPGSSPVPYPTGNRPYMNCARRSSTVVCGPC